MRVEVTNFKEVVKLDKQEHKRKVRAAAELLCKVPTNRVDKVVDAAMIMSGGKIATHIEKLARVLKYKDKETRIKILDDAKKLRAKWMA